MASKYAPLGDHLRAQRAQEVPMSFADVERIVRRPLPPSARRHRPWWSNNARNSVMTKVWLEAGFKAEAVDLEAERVVFRRVQDRTERTEDRVLPRHPAAGFLKGMVTIMPGTDLTAPADPGWGKVYD